MNRFSYSVSENQNFFIKFIDINFICLSTWTSYVYSLTQFRILSASRLLTYDKTIGKGNKQVLSKMLPVYTEAVKVWYSRLKPRKLLGMRVAHFARPTGEHSGGYAFSMACVIIDGKNNF